MEINYVLMLASAIGMALGSLVTHLFSLSRREEDRKTIENLLESKDICVQVINQQDDKIAELRKQVLFDSLTGLYSRAAFEKELERQVAQRNREPSIVCSMLMIDCDYFKSINDMYGHLVGNEVLQAIADCIQMVSRPSDFPVRFGGDEFIILLPNRESNTALLLAERLLQSARKIRFAQYPDIQVTLSIGIATADQKITPKHLIKQADQAMYQAKNSGRDRVEVCQE